MVAPERAASSIVGAVKIGRFALYVLRELRWPLGIATGLVLAGGILFSLSLGEPYPKACYTVFMLMLGEPTAEFPDRWYTQLLFFAVPIVGLGAIADSVVRLGYLIFSSKRKLEEWWIMEASTYRNHIVVCGLGRVGYRIAHELRALGETVVAVDRNRESIFAGEFLDLGVPVLFGEVRLRQTLEKANVAHAKAVILATDDDLANLDAALTAREIRPDVRVVLRLFDDTLARKVAGAFNLPAISTSQVSAPAFVAAATGRSVLHSFQIENETIHVADLRVLRLAGRTGAQIQKDFGASVVMHKSIRGGTLGPDPARALEAGDTLVLAAPPSNVRALEEANRA
jgi:voltage-gated potassium channel